MITSIVVLREHFEIISIMPTVYKGNSIYMGKKLKKLPRFRSNFQFSPYISHLSYTIDRINIDYRNKLTSLIFSTISEKNIKIEILISCVIVAKR